MGRYSRFKVDDNIETDYKGGTIKYDRVTNKWQARLRGDLVGSYDSMQAGMNAIDRLLKPKIEPIPALERVGGWGDETEEFRRVLITSYNNEDDEAWVTYPDQKKQSGYFSRGNRAKLRISNLIADSPENKAVLADISKVRKEREGLDKKIKALNQKLVGVKLPEVKKDGEA